MRLSFLLACEYASVLATGSPVLVGVFREVIVDADRMWLDPFFLALEIEADFNEAGIHDLELRMIDADGAEVYRQDLQVEFRSRPDYGPSYAFLPLFVALTRTVVPGSYRFDLICRGESLGSKRIDVRAA